MANEVTGWLAANTEPAPNPLPPMPKPFVQNWPSGRWTYTADQMRAYARECVLAERERCAKQLERLGNDHCAAALRNQP